MSIMRPDAEPLRSSRAVVGRRIVAAAAHFVSETDERVLVLLLLAAYVAVFMLFWTISSAALDIDADADQGLLWGRHFAFGYIHPPLTLWLFGLWFAIFPHRAWAVDLLNVTMMAAALGVTWRLLRDHLDKDRALLGLLALLLIPFYDVKAEVLNANTVMIPVWAATLLFYLRARRSLGWADAFLAGAFASVTVLGKYWAVFLLAGMAVACLVGPGARRFWRSAAPYAMAAGAALVIAPHVWWLVTQHGGESIHYAANVAINEPYSAALRHSLKYLLGAVAYIAGPLVVLAALRPSRAALADIAWPADDERRQVVLLLVLPLVFPVLLNLVIPYRLTAAWTFPNWALLPVVLYGSRHLRVDEGAVARAIVFVVAAAAVIIAATPLIAGLRLAHGPNPYRSHFRQAAELAERLAGGPVRLYWGSDPITSGLAFYLPKAEPMTADPLSAAGRGEIARSGLAAFCLADDRPCLAMSQGFEKLGGRTTNAALTRTFLGFSSRPLNIQITVVPPGEPPARTGS
jgi:hypothetical protein